MNTEKASEMTHEEMVEKIKALDESRTNMLKHFTEKIRTLTEEIETNKEGVKQINNSVNAILIAVAKKYGTEEADGSLVLNVERPRIDKVEIYDIKCQIDATTDSMEIKIKQNEIQE